MFGKKFIMRNIFIMAALFSILGRLMGAEDKPAFEVATIYKDMRNLSLKLNEKDFPDLKDKPVFAVLMESGFAEGSYTLAAAFDGAASLYYSNGGGLIGSGEHANVRPESLKVVKMAEKYLQQMQKVDAFPIVKPGITTFYIVTGDGVFSYTAKEDDLGEQRDKKLSDLFHQCHSLITQMRIVDEKRQVEQDGAGQPATRTESKSDGDENPNPEAEGRSR